MYFKKIIPGFLFNRNGNVTFYSGCLAEKNTAPDEKIIEIIWFIK